MAIHKLSFLIILPLLLMNCPGSTTQSSSSSSAISIKTPQDVWAFLDGQWKTESTEVNWQQSPITFNSKTSSFSFSLPSSDDSDTYSESVTIKWENSRFITKFIGASHEPGKSELLPFILYFVNNNIIELCHVPDSKDDSKDDPKRGFEHDPKPEHYVTLKRQPSTQSSSSAISIIKPEDVWDLLDDGRWTAWNEKEAWNISPITFNSKTFSFSFSLPSSDDPDTLTKYSESFNIKWEDSRFITEFIGASHEPGKSALLPLILYFVNNNIIELYYVPGHRYGDGTRDKPKYYATLKRQ